MKKHIFSFILAILLLVGCDDLSSEYRLPTQEFAKVLELDGRLAGRLFGKIVFPSAYTQRSVRFSLSGRTFVSQPDGRFVVENIPVGEHKLFIQIKNYEPIVQAVMITEEGMEQLGPWRLKLARGKVIGRLVGENGKSAARVKIRLVPLDGWAQTDSDGIFQFIGVHSGKHILRIMDEQFFTYNRQFNLDKGEQRNLGNIKVFRKVDFNLSRTAGMKIDESTPPRMGIAR